MLSATQFAPSIGASKVAHRSAPISRSSPAELKLIKLNKVNDDNDSIIEQYKDNLDKYPVKPQSKDRSGEFAVKLSGADRVVQTYLDGSLPADYGFDPLYLYRPDTGFANPAWLRHAEVLHGRWAMLGAAGCVAPEILGSLGMIPPETANPWWESGVIPPAGYSYEYWCEPWGLFWIQAMSMNFAELKRYYDFQNPGSQAKQWFLGIEGIFQGAGNQYESCYPGGPFFNFMGLAKGGDDDPATKTMRTKEINNGRLAMIAMMGFAGEAIICRKTPMEALYAHLSDPVHNNFLTNLTHLGF